MPWPGFWRIIFGSAGQQAFNTSDEAGAEPPDGAEACYVSVVGSPSVSISFGERKSYEEGLIIHADKQPFLIPFAERMWFTTRDESPATVSVLWLSLRLLPRPKEP
jgi:hypothetical protein